MCLKKICQLVEGDGIFPAAVVQVGMHRIWNNQKLLILRDWVPPPAELGTGPPLRQRASHELQSAAGLPDLSGGEVGVAVDPAGGKAQGMSGMAWPGGGAVASLFLRRRSSGLSAFVGMAQVGPNFRAPGIRPSIHNFWARRRDRFLFSTASCTAM